MNDVEIREKQEDDLREHQDGDARGETAEAGGGNRHEEGGKIEVVLQELQRLRAMCAIIMRQQGFPRDEVRAGFGIDVPMVPHDTESAIILPGLKVRGS